MNILFASVKGELLSLARRAKGEGYSVKLFIKDNAYRERGEGMVEKAFSPMNGGFTPDLVVCGSGCGKVGEMYREKGVKVWGACQWSDLVALNSQYREQLERVAEVNLPVNEGGFWNGKEFSCVYKVLKWRGFMNGGLGKDVVSGCAVRVEEGDEIRKLEKLLRGSEYRGPIVLGERLEAGFNLPVFAAVSAITKGSVVDLVDGDRVPVDGLVGGCALVSVAPFPHGLSVERNTQWIGRGKREPFTLEDGGERHFWEVDTRYKAMCGIDGELGWISARGGDLKEVRRRVYRSLDRVREMVSEVQYRTDLF